MNKSVIELFIEHIAQRNMKIKIFKIKKDLESLFQNGHSKKLENRQILKEKKKELCPHNLIK